MATPATLNAWLDELSLSMLKGGLPSRQSDKRLQDTFRRRVRRHNNARTNQFEVVERLDGLEEKFQILTLDNLSDALHQRRSELKDFEHLWLPDVLDFFLHLSEDPTRNDSLREIYRVPPRLGTPPPLRWKDVLADDPVDCHDKLWRVPDFRDTDDSGYDDDDETDSMIESSPPLERRQNIVSSDLGTSTDWVLQPAHAASPDSHMRNVFPREMTDLRETVYIREMLFCLRGHPTSLLVKHANGYELHNTVIVHGISSAVLNSLSGRVSTIRHDLDLVKEWTAGKHEYAYIEALKYAIEMVLDSYNSQINSMQQRLIDGNHATTASMIRIMSEVQDASADVTIVAEYLRTANGGDPVSYLETLFYSIQIKHACSDGKAYSLLLRLFISSLDAYLRPLWMWLDEGKLEETSPFLFVKSNLSDAGDDRLWHSRYFLVEEGRDRAPDFLAGLADLVVACGKTASFIRRLSYVDDNPQDQPRKEFSLHDVFQSAEVNSYLPVAETLQSALSEHVNTLLARHTKTLKSLLDSRCGTQQTLDGIEQVYLGRNMIILEDIEPRLFNKIDHCLDDWNDRFQLRDMLEAAFSLSGNYYTIDAVTIRSSFTSSRTMQSRRCSVKILSALSFDYRLTWPLANIIDEKSMSMYRHVALALMQIRRARFSLEQVGYHSVMTLPLDGEVNPQGQRFAQTFAFELLNFVNNLYHCLTASIIQPLTQKMRCDMEDALTVDDMINVHWTYINRVECATLSTSKLKLLRQSLFEILDLCIRFSDLVSKTRRRAGSDSDGEVGSFTSAFSRHGHRLDSAPGPDSESDEIDPDGNMGEGYSTFIVLEDETNVVKELTKLKAQYRRRRDFFVAGLRGVGKAGQHVQDLIVLADRLT